MEGLPARPVRGGDGAPGGRGASLSGGRRILLWRHGRTAWNVGGRFQGQLDSELDPAGMVDVQLAAQVLAKLPPARLFSSSSGRALRTARYLERECGMTAEVSPDLREIYLGAWQGLSGEEARARFPDEWAAWLRGEDVRRGGGETYAEVGVRAAAVLLDAVRSVRSGEVVVAVTHGGTARALTGHLIGLPVETWWRLAPLGNARWTVLIEAERGFRLAEHNAGVTEPVDRSRISAPDVEPESDESDESDEGLAASADI